MSWVRVFFVAAMASLLSSGTATPQGKADVPELIKQLKDKDEFVRLKAAKSLGKLGADAKDAVPALEEAAAKDTDADVRAVAKQAVETINTAVGGAMRMAVLDKLDKSITASKDRDPDVRKKAVQTLASLLAEPDAVIRLKVTQTLGELGIDAEFAADALKVATKDTDEAVRKSARRALDKLEEAVELRKTAKAREAVAPLLKELKAREPEKRVKALEKIGAMGPDVAFAAEDLVEAMMDRTLAIRNAASEALEKVLPRVQPHLFTLMYGERKLLAIDALGRLGEEAKAALPVFLYYHANAAAPGGAGLGNLDLLSVMSKIAPKDRRFAQAVLATISTPNPRNDNFLAAKRIEAIRQLATIDADTETKVKVLVTALGDGANAVLVIETLEGFGKDAAPALPLLKKLKFSPNDAVRNAAVSALAKIE